MLRSIETQMRASGTPRSSKARTTKPIITSGPQTNADAVAGSTAASGISVVTSPTRPSQPAAAASTVSATSTPDSAAHRSDSSM